MDALSTGIRQRMDVITGRIAQAAQSSGRRLQDVHLVVVTKAQSVEIVQAVVDAGAQIFGENYPEETVPKIQSIGRKDITWHMIGHLQSRKAPLIAAHFDMLESLDSLHLAEKLERLLVEQNRVLPVLLEVNVSGEETKYGFSGWDKAHWDNLLPVVEQVLALPHLSVQGLMTMPPLYDDPEQTRPYFARLRELSEYLAKAFDSAHFHALSMGTSADFEAAVQEGATYVRIGTAIVGPRPKKVP